MKAINYIIFYSIFFLVYGLVNYYIYIRGLHSLPQNSSLRHYYIVIFLFVSCSFVLGRLLERLWQSPLSEVLVWVGSFWLGAMLYFVLSLLLIDVFRLLNHLFSIFPSLITDNLELTKKYTAYVVTSIVFIVISIGYLNARSPRIKKLDLLVYKKVEHVQSLNIVVASDIHLGSIIGKRRFDEIVNIINSLNPDLVLFPGDIVDEDVASVIQDNVGQSFKKIKSKYGVFAVTGNHEYISGVERACWFLQKNGINMLRDSTVLVDNIIYLVGREDRSSQRFAGRERKSLEDLLSKVNTDYPVLLMDHQPFQLDEAEKHRIDLQLSGHTHNGQLWPFNYIASAIYEVSWGYLKKNNTHYYISCGVGSWGPPMRLGNIPEIVNIKLRFAQH